MSKTHGLAVGLVALLGATLVVSPVYAKGEHGKVQLPEPVTNTLKNAFPGAEITKVDAEKEGGVEVYDIEFKEGGLERECDITATGEILNVSAVVDPKFVPASAMKAIKAAAAGGTIGQIEKAEIRAETKDGKVVKLERSKTQFEADLRKNGQRAEITVDGAGAVIEAPKWVKAGRHGKEGKEERE